MKTSYHYVCVRCGRNYPEAEYVCPRCGVGGNLDIVYDMDRVRRVLTQKALAANHDYTLWRYRPLLPVSESGPFLSLPVGWTPLIDSPRLASEFGVRRVWIKDEGRNPTASLKDRASAVCVATAQERGHAIVTCASTGNAASSLAGACAHAGLRSVIFTPERAPLPKLAQLLLFGATLCRIRGSYDTAYDLALQATERFGWYNRNSGFNPCLGEGKKTAALELCEQLRWQAPDAVVVPVGDGCILGGLWKGFCDLHELGWIERRPRMIGVQAAGAAPIVRAFEQGTAIEPGAADTIADGIAVGHPRDGDKALRALRESGGLAVAVTDEEIRDALRRLPRATGVFAEPAAAASYAGLVKLSGSGQLASDEAVVLMITGSGLKDVETAISSVQLPPVVEPSLEAVAAAAADLAPCT